MIGMQRKLTEADLDPNSTDERKGDLVGGIAMSGCFGPERFYTRSEVEAWEREKREREETTRRARRSAEIERQRRAERKAARKQRKPSKVKRKQRRRQR